MNKKGAELSMNVIVIAAIVLLVLVVLSIIFLGRVGIFSKQVGDCTSKGGSCQLKTECDISKMSPGTNCETDKEGGYGPLYVCCLG